jgi:2-polyprenyl-3-methyl-5-hydroxy-6-metoxy-1,4-benzoquinol methylase
MTIQTNRTNKTIQTNLTKPRKCFIPRPSYGTIQGMIRELFNSLFYRFWYLSRPPWDSGISPPELMTFLENHPAGRALDLGCGTATNVITMVQNGWEATGIDFVPKAIRAGKMKASKAGVQVILIRGDVSERKNLQGPYDLVLDMGCYHSLTQEQRQRYRNNLSEVMAPGATYMLYAFTDREGRRSDSVVNEKDIEGFKEFLTLEKREDGNDRGQVSSSWFWFRKPVISEQ